MARLTRQQDYILRQQTGYWLAKASLIVEQNIPQVPVLLDLSGSAAGQFRGGARPCIRYNPIIAAQTFTEFVARTVPHEVAHYVVDRLFAAKRVKPHGAEWQSIMRVFGLEPGVCHRYDLSQVPVRRQSRYAYICDCRQHQLSATRHNRVQGKGIRYLCSQCGSTLKPASVADVGLAAVSPAI